MGTQEVRSPRPQRRLTYNVNSSLINPNFNINNRIHFTLNINFRFRVRV